MIRINLLPYRAERKKELIVQQVIIAAGPLLLAFIIIGFFWWSLNSEKSAVDDQIASLKSKINGSKVKMKEIEDYKAKKQTLENKMDVIKTLLKNKSGPVHIIDEMASNLPGSLWLTKVQQKGMGLQISGKALDNISISNYMINLEKSKYFSNIDLLAIKTAKSRSAQGALIKSFDLVSKIVYETDKKKKSGKEKASGKKKRKKKKRK